MRSYLINKNLCLYYRLKRVIGKQYAYPIISGLEWVILLFGREKRG